MNGYDDSFKRMQTLMQEIELGDGRKVRLLKETCYYPIFINWNSHPVDSLIDDLFRIRFGRPDAALSILTSPLMIAVRAVTSAASVPLAFIHNGDLFVEKLNGASEEQDTVFSKMVDTGPYLPLYGAYIGTIPLLEGFGTPAWDIMKRRAQLTIVNELTDEPGRQNASFVRTQRFLEQLSLPGFDPLSGQSPAQSRVPQDAPGGLISPTEKTPCARDIAQKAVRALTTVDEGAARPLVRCIGESLTHRDGSWFWRQTKVEVQITLVGHSMGSMIVNRMLSMFENRPAENVFPVRHLVYMAPAAPTDEVDDFVLPYLNRANTLGSARNTAFWMFLLNRRDEVREIPLMTLGLFPRGSLLAWIDTFFEKENTWGQATSGRMWNLRQSYGMEPLQIQVSAPNLPLSRQFRKRMLLLGSHPRKLQDQGVFNLYDSPRRMGANNVPGEHGDFTKPKYLFEVLCHVEPTAFRDPAFCDQSPNNLE